MKRFFCCVGIVSILLCHATQEMVEAAPATIARIPYWSTPKAFPATRGNFVSLEMQTSGGFANIQTRLLISGNSISLTQKVPSTDTAAPQTSALSNNQLHALVQLLSEARFTTIVGKYNQPQLRDGINEVVTLKLSDSNNVDRTFLVENYGDTAPAGYYKVTAYLRQLQQQKFPPQSTVADAGDNTATTLPKIAAGNFETLEYHVSEGYAHPTTLTIRRTPSVFGREAYNIGVDYLSPSSTGDFYFGNLSDRDFSTLFRVLNEAQLPLITCKYTQRDLQGGIRERLLLTLRGADGKSHVYDVEDYGTKAPQAFYKMTEYLRQLISKVQDSGTTTR